MHAIRGTPDELQWGPTGTEVRLLLKDVRKVRGWAGEDNYNLAFELRDGRVVELGRETLQHRELFRFLRRHFTGEMTWNGRRIVAPDQRLSRWGVPRRPI